jgi:hypothetical protein
MDENVSKVKQTPSAIVDGVRTEMSGRFDTPAYSSKIEGLEYWIMGYATGCSNCCDTNYGSWFGKDVQYIMNDIQCRYEGIFGKKMDCRQNEYDHHLMIDCLKIYCPSGSGFCVKCDTYYIDWECNCESE